MLFKKLFLSLGIILSLANPASLYAVTLIPGGDSIGIELDYQGVMITGGYKIEVNRNSYNPLASDFKVGDIIVSAKSKKVTSIEELSEAIKANSTNNSSLEVSILRKNQELKKELQVVYDGQQYSTGLYVKDSLNGVGTLTFYNPASHTFAALGHAMIDSKIESNELVQSGNIFESSVTSIKKAIPGVSGNKVANVSDVKIGSINSHNQIGIYGTYNYNLDDRMSMETAEIDEIKLGKAYFLTVLENNEIQKCEIEITKLNQQSEISEKGIEFKVVDTELIKKANGIVQGMSGSPIIQDNKIVGCVTHVSGNDPIIGYGLYIEWMLEMDK